jgi:hypothetical protein
MQRMQQASSANLRTAAAIAVVALTLLADYAATFAYGDPRANYVAVGGVYGLVVAFASVAAVLLCRGRGLVTTGLFLALLVVFLTMITVLAKTYGDYHPPTAVVVTHGAVVAAAIASLVFYFVALAR